MIRKIEKNYFRTELFELAKEAENVFFILTGKYKHTENQKWATFTTIRPYIPGQKTFTVCNHINIKRESVSRYLMLTEKMHNRKFYICAWITEYEHYGELRAGVELADTKEQKPIWMAAQTKYENESLAQLVLKSVQKVSSKVAEKRYR